MCSVSTRNYPQNNKKGSELDNTCNSECMDFNFKIPLYIFWYKNMIGKYSVAFKNDYSVKARTHRYYFVGTVSVFASM